MYHCLPSALDGEDAARLLRGQNALGLYRAAKKPFKQWTPAEYRMMGPVMEADLKRQNESI